jgi:PAS domain S-box-containing protein
VTETRSTLSTTELYRLLIDQVQDFALIVLDAEGRVVTWNSGAQRIKGYSAEEIIGQHFSVFYPPDVAQKGWPEHELSVASEAGRFEDEGWRVRKDSSRFWASVVITALRAVDGKLAGFAKVTRDLTERKRQHEALRQSEERFRLLVESVLDYAIFMLDEEGRVASWNSGAERMKGYSRDEILGAHLSRFYCQEDVNVGKPSSILALALQSGRAEDEGWRIRKSGERFWARTVVTPVRDSCGTLLGFTKVTQDLTDRHHRRQLERTAENLNEFIAMLAHELRNPLAPIRVATRVMQGPPPLPAEHEAMRQIIDRQGARLTHVVDNLVDVARIARGAFSIDSSLIDLRSVVHAAVDTLPSDLKSRAVWTLDLPGEMLPLNGDAHRLGQLVANLLDNAARYTPQGGSITVSTCSDRAQVVLIVRDTGRGIEPEMMSRLFDMFVQGRSPLKRVEGGLGIGLAIGRKVAELHGGSLVASSDGLGKGSEFRLTLPLASAQSSAAAGSADGSTPEPQPTPGHAKRVLVVDDNVDAADTLGLLLQSLGHDTRVVYEGAVALDVVPDFKPDIVLLDLGMPGLDGYDVARRLRKLEREQHFQLVAVTGWGQDADKAQSKAAGFDVHLVKPVDVKSLVQVLAEHNGSALH